MEQLPREIVDDILSRLEGPSLLALCCTSKSLYAVTNPYLYSVWANRLGFDNCRKPSKFKKLESSLSLNPANLRYIDGLTSTSMGVLKTLLSNPIHLKSLRLLLGGWLEKEDVDSLLSNLHPDVEINFIIVDRAAVYALIEAEFLQRLSAFQGLQRISIHATDFLSDAAVPYGNVKKIVSQIDCPQLEQLCFIDALSIAAGLLKFPTEKFPRLRSLHYLYREAEPDIPKGLGRTMWENVLSLQNKRIYLTLSKWEGEESEDLSLQLTEMNPVLDESQLNRDIPWIVQGSVYLQTQIWRRNFYLLDLTDIEDRPRRDLVLGFIKTLKLTCEVRIHVNAYARDSDTFYLPNSALRTSQLHNLISSRTRYLRLHVTQSIHTQFIPMFLKKLTNIEHLFIVVPCRIADEDSNDPDAVKKLQLLEPSAWCTRAGFVFQHGRTKGSILDREIELRRGDTPRWRMLWGGYGSKEHEIPWIIPNEDVGSKNANLVAELSSWFKFSCTLQMITFRIEEEETKELEY